MKRVWTLIAIVITVLFVGTLWLGPGAHALAGEASPQTVQPQDAAPAFSTQMPVYQPPLRGAPGGRIGGGTRGPGEALPVLFVLAPDHTGLTIEEQPSLFWYLSGPAIQPIEVTLIDEKAVEPLLSARIQPPLSQGIYRTRLAEHGVRLLPGIRYRWYVALVVDPDRRSRDVLAGATIERIERPTQLDIGQPGEKGAAGVDRYASAGIWYDALGCISDMVESSPRESLFRYRRAALLDQVGLSEVALFEMEQVGAK